MKPGRLLRAQWVLVLASCGTPPAPVVSQPDPAPVLTCPACPETTCPTCPECATCPEPEEPQAWDWHCMDLRRRSSGQVSTYCFTLERVCEDMRKASVKEKYGKPSACTTQRIAHCLESADPTSMSRQIVCARTPKGCEDRRQYLLDNPRFADEELTECEPRLNTDRYTNEQPTGPSSHAP